MDLAEWAREVLRVVWSTAITDREKQMTGPVEEKAAAIVGGVERRVVFLIRAEKRFLINPTVVFDPSADDDGHRCVRRSSGFDVGEVNPAVFRVVGMHGDIEETAILFHVNRG